LLTLAACGDSPSPDSLPGPPPEKKPSRAREFRRRFLDVDWKDVAEYETKDLVLGLRGYIDSDDPVWPNDDRHYDVLTNFLVRTQPDPKGLLPLLGEHEGKQQVDMHLLKRDKIARALVHSLMGRVWRANERESEGDDLVAVWDAIVYTAVYFSFEAVYEASHPGTSESLAEFFSDPKIMSCDESRKAFEHYADELVARWGKRVTRKASSMFFGNMLRHLGPGAADRLYGEWEGMDANERYDLLRRSLFLDPFGPVSRLAVVNALLDDSFDVRGAAADLLTRLEAPLGDLDGSAQDEAIEKALPALREWAAKTKS